MQYLKRYLEAAIQEDLQQKMVFLSGPRQSGKTTLARELLRRNGSQLKPAYLNGDAGADRERILQERFPAVRAVQMGLYEEAAYVTKQNIELRPAVDFLAGLI